MMLGRLDRMVLREVLFASVAATLVIGLLFVTNELIALLRLANLQGVPFLATLQLAVLRGPYWLVWSLPIGLSLGAALGIGRLVRESELTALRSAGISIRRVLVPIALMGLAGGGLQLWLSNRAVPQTVPPYLRLQAELAVRSAEAPLQADVFMKLGRFHARFGSVERLGEGRMKIRDVLLLEILSADQVAVYQAAEGEYRDGFWRFPRAVIQMARGGSPDQAPASLDRIEIKDLALEQPLRADVMTRPPQPDELSPEELEEAIRLNRSVGRQTANLELQLIQRWANPTACILLCLASAVAAVRFGRNGPIVAALAAFGLAAVYLNAQVIASQVLGRGDLMNVAAVAWLPAGIVGLVLLLSLWGVE